MKDWFERYAAAFDAFDAAAIAGFFVAPCLMVSEATGAVLLPDADAVRGNMEAVCDFHRAAGYERALVRGLRVDETSPSFRFATVDWRVERAGGPDWDFTNTYQLARSGQPEPGSGEWRIVVATTHGSA